MFREVRAVPLEVTSFHAVKQLIRDKVDYTVGGDKAAAAERGTIVPLTTELFYPMLLFLLLFIIYSSTTTIIFSFYSYNCVYRKILI